MTMAQGSAGRASWRGGGSDAGAVLGFGIGWLSGMMLFRGAGRYRRAFWAGQLRFGIDGLFALDMAAKAETHGREHLSCEGVLLSRSEPGIERR